MNSVEWPMLIRIVVAFVLGGLIGLQRELSHEPAGLRTHMLVAGGAASFMVLSVLGVPPASGATALVGDRIASQIVTGIGFLGAGTIWRTPSTVRGLTTAASIWMTAAIGMLTAAGLYILAVAGMVLAVVVLHVMKIPERRLVPTEDGDER